MGFKEIVVQVAGHFDYFLCHVAKSPCRLSYLINVHVALSKMLNNVK